MPLARIPSLRAVSLGLLAATLVVVVGCGGPPEHDAPAGTTVLHDGVAYRVPTDVFLTDRPFTLRFGAGDRAAVQLDL